MSVHLNNCCRKRVFRLYASIIFFLISCR